MVGGLSAFDPVDEENNDKDAQANIAAQQKIQATVTPQQAAKVSELYKQNGWVSPRVLLDMAKQQGLSQQERVLRLNDIAITQMTSITRSPSLKKLQ